MHVISVNGETYTVGTFEDAVEIVRDKLGCELADILQHNSTYITDEVREEVLEGSDYYSYEASLEEYHSALMDISEAVDRIKTAIDSKRTDKHYVRSVLADIQKILGGVL